MRLGLFGGSFDPIHRGHVEPVLEAAERLGLDRVVYLPTGRPPHKPDRKLAPALPRYAMTDIALLEHQDLWVSAFELSEERPSYTIDTILHFRAKHPAAEIFLLVGADSYAELRLWHRWEAILDNATLVVLDRPPIKANAAKIEGSSAAPVTDHRVVLAGNSPRDVSSTEIRALLARRERPPSSWMSSAVVDFALKYRLYR